MKALRFTFIVLFSLSSMQLFAHNEESNPNITPYNDAVESKAGYKIQYLKKQPAWKNFIAAHPSWGARFNRYTQLPHRAIGDPISFGMSGDDLVAKSKDFINSELAAYEIPTHNLIATRNFNDGKYINVDFKQFHNGMEVLWSNVVIRYSQDERIVMFGADAHTKIPQLMNVVLTPAQAQQKAENALTTHVLNSDVRANKKIIPVPVDGKYEYHIVYEVYTNTQDTKDMPGKYLSYVDAETGKIWYRDNDVKQIGFNVNADLYPTNLFNPSQLLELKHLRIVSGGNTYYTDNTGSVTIPGTTFGGTLHLDGRYCDIVTTQNGTTSPSVSPTTVVNNGSYTFPAATTAPEIQHFTTYFHVNEVHDFMKSKLPTFTAMDNPLTTRIDRTDGSCNAFYNGSSINFYTTNSGCNALSKVNTVIYHEYGHGISNVFYNAQGANFSNGGLGEGNSDVWAMFINDGPIVGQGFNVNSPNSNIRRYDVNPKIFPQDLVGQVHADGEIIAGCWWDTYQYWGSLDSVSSLFAQAQYGLANGPNGTEGEIYFDILIDALQYDDTDNNIGNGTPHFSFIVEGFADHGIYLLNNSEVTHPHLGYQPSGAPFDVLAEVETDFTPFVGDLNVVYRKRGASGLTKLLMNKNNLSYDIPFPSQTAGDIYEYFFELEDNLNSYSIAFPKNGDFSTPLLDRNLPYYVMIGYKPVYQELFDGANAPNGWTIGNATGDNAIRGLWTHDTPVPSFQDINDSSTIIQTYSDANGGGKCLVTGNAGAATASIGQADVDGGKTTVISPSIDISSYTNPVLGYFRWYSNSQGSNPRKDIWIAQISYNGGNSWFYLDRTEQPDVSWRWQVVPLLKSSGTNILVRFIAEDLPQQGAGGSLVEAAIDAFEIFDLGEVPLSISAINTLNFQLYPNPTKESVNLILPEQGRATYEIINAVGQTMRSKEINQQSRKILISTNDLASGVYFIRVSQAGQTNIKKLSVRR